MVRKISSLRGAHLVMWSSPLLLLVLLFTLTTSTKPSTPPSTTEHLVLMTTTTIAARTAPTTSTTLKAVPRSLPYAASTSLTVKSPAHESSASVSSGVMTGVLTADLSVADVPLAGPGTWTLLSSAPLLAQLLCPTATSTANDRVVISGHQDCQLQLTSTNREVSPTWQLTPAR